MQSVKSPLILSDTNNDNNTTNVMQVSTLYSNIITDGTAVLEDGFISNITDPVNDNELATKYYIDNASGGGGSSGPDYSLQYNNGGSFAGSSNLTLTDPDTASAVLNINGTLTNGTMTLSSSQFSGLTNPIDGGDAATKNYVDEAVNGLGVISINLVQNVKYTYTPTEIYNNIINISYSPDNILGVCTSDDFPTVASMVTFLGSDFQVGKSWKTVFRGPQSGDNLFVRFIASINLLPISYLYCSLPLPVLTIINFSVATIVSVITDATPGSEIIYSYVTNYYNDITTNSQITDRGVITPSLGTGTFLGTGSIIYPIPEDPTQSSASSIVYSYDDLQKYLIIRLDLIADTSDTFDPAATIVTNDAFLMGGGTFKFFIQNPNAFVLTLVSAVGWSFTTGSSGVIPANHCGSFWVNVVISPPSCTICSLGTNPING